MDSGLTRVIKITLDGPRASRYQSSITHKVPRAPLSRVHQWSEVSGVCSNIGRKILRRLAGFLQFLFRHSASQNWRQGRRLQQTASRLPRHYPPPSDINRPRTPDTRHQMMIRAPGPGLSSRALLANISQLITRVTPGVVGQLSGNIVSGCLRHAPLALSVFCVICFVRLSLVSQSRCPE